MTQGLSEGARIGGRYVLRNLLAKGGMANVWLASSEGAGGFQKKVVIKTILPNLADYADFKRMFVEEALVAARLSHPNVIQIFDLGECQGSYFIAMEHIDGRTLRQLNRQLKASRVVPPAWFVLQVIAAACDGLEHAHNHRDEAGNLASVVHRDVSPENIMVAFTGDTKVLDFGIAKASTGTTKTRTGVLKGKHAYMAPEQIEAAASGTGPDLRSDIYALGVVLYEMLSGRRPYRAPNPLALMRAILEGAAEPLHARCPWVPQPLSELVAKAMSRTADERFQTAGELRDAIEAYLRGTGTFPTRADVAAYMRAAFDREVHGSHARPTPSAELPIAEVEEQADPDVESPLTVDVSVLLSGADVLSVEEASGPSRRAPPAPKLGDAEAAAPEPPAEDAAARPIVEVVPAKPSVYQPDEPASQRTPSIGSDRGSIPSSQIWDLLTQRAREAKQAESSRVNAEPTSQPAPDASRALESVKSQVDDGPVSGWDRVVSRIQRDSEPKPAPQPDDGGPVHAADWFDAGLRCWKSKDLEGTLECWTKAVELDPENRRYRSNLRKLERRVAEHDAELEPTQRRKL